MMVVEGIDDESRRGAEMVRMRVDVPVWVWVWRKEVEEFRAKRILSLKLKPFLSLL